MVNQSLGIEMPCTQMCRLNHILCLLTGISKRHARVFSQSYMCLALIHSSQKAEGQLGSEKERRGEAELCTQWEESDQSSLGRSEWHWDKSVVRLSPCHAACGYLG